MTVLDWFLDWFFMRFGDTVKIQITNDNGEDIFGTIEQKVVKYGE